MVLDEICSKTNFPFKTLLHPTPKVVYHPTFSFKTAFRMLILMFSNVGTSAQRFLLKTTTGD